MVSKFETNHPVMLYHIPEERKLLNLYNYKLTYQHAIGSGHTVPRSIQMLNSGASDAICSGKQ